MSCINVYRHEYGRDVSGLTISVPEKTDRSFRDGEELAAAAAIIDLVGELDNGEALIITADIF